ncbi:MAG: hypothetical protein R2725_13320 [Solirubrobacterales bacterium]
MAVQGGSQASLRRTGNGDYELIVESPDPRTVYFDVSPSRRVQTASVAKLPFWARHAAGRNGDRPNLDLSWDEEGGTGSLVAELLQIDYEKAGDTLSARLAPLTLAEGGPAVTGATSLGRQPFSNASVNLVFDNSEYTRCFTTIELHGDAAEISWNLKSSSAEHDDWAPGSPPQGVGNGTSIGSETNSPFLGCEFTATYDDGAGNTFTVGVDNPLIGSPSYTCTGSSGVLCEGQSVEREGGGEAFQQADIYYR